MEVTALRSSRLKGSNTSVAIMAMRIILITLVGFFNPTFDQFSFCSLNPIHDNNRLQATPANNKVPDFNSMTDGRMTIITCSKIPFLLFQRGKGCLLLSCCADIEKVFLKDNISHNAE